MELPDSILSEKFSTDFIAFWRCGTESHWHKDPRALLVDGASYPLCYEQLSAARLSVEPLLAAALQGCGSSIQLCFPHTVLCRNYVDGLKDSSLGNNSLSCHKPGLSAGVGVPLTHRHSTCWIASWWYGNKAHGITCEGLQQSCRRKPRWSEEILVSTLLFKYSTSLEVFSCQLLSCQDPF